MTYTLMKHQQIASQSIDEPWGSLTWLAGQQVGNAHGVTLGRVIIKPGQANPRHSHANCEEVLYLMQGTLVHTLGGEEVTMTAGDVLTVPAEIPHNATNIGDEDADMIVAYSEGVRMFDLEET